MRQNDIDGLTVDLIDYVKMRLAMALFPVRGALLKMGRDVLAENIKRQAWDIGQGVKDLVEQHLHAD